MKKLWHFLSGHPGEVMLAWRVQAWCEGCESWYWPEWKPDMRIR